jgi:hypothetical protein
LQDDKRFWSANAKPMLLQLTVGIALFLLLKWLLWT